MAKEYEVARENWNSYTFNRDNGHTDFVEKANLCDKFFQGIQWEEKIRRKLERESKPVLTINKTLATLLSVMGEQINNRVDVSFKPFRDGNSMTATALAKTFLHIANMNRLHWKESEVFDDGVITSRGFFDVRMKFDRQMIGDVSITVLNPRNVAIDADADAYDPDSWKDVHITKWMSVEEIEQTYGKDKADKIRMMPQSGFDLGYDSIDDWEDSFSGNTRGQNGTRPEKKKRVRVIERQYRKAKNTPHFVDPRTGDMRPVPESWGKRRVAKTLQMMGWEIIDRITQRIRWTVTADTVVLFDEWSPYEHFTVVPYFPIFRRGKTLGLVEHILSPQESLNKTSSQELHVVNSSANGGWKVKRGSLHNMDPDELESRGAETGLVLELDNPDDAQKIQPNQIPSGLDRITYKMDEFIKEVSGVSDSRRGFDREDVAAKAIKAKQAAGSVNLAKPMDNLVRTRYLLARNVLSLIQRYYTEERVMQITEDVPGAETEEVTVNQMTPEGEVVNDLTVGTYDVVISSVPSRESYMDTQFEEAKALREMGIPIPDHHIIASSHLARKNEIVEAMQNDPAAQRQQQMSELEMAQMQADLQGKQAEAGRKQAETELAGARAQKTQVDAQKTQVDVQKEAMEPPDNSTQVEMAKIQMQMQLEREKLRAQMQLEQQKLQMEMQLKAEEARQNRLLKMAEAEERLEQQKHQTNKAAWNGNYPS
jgi:hypothetical protein